MQEVIGSIPLSSTKPRLEKDGAFFIVFCSFSAYAKATAGKLVERPECVREGHRFDPVILQLIFKLHLFQDGAFFVPAFAEASAGTSFAKAMAVKKWD